MEAQMPDDRDPFDLAELLRMERDPFDLGELKALVKEDAFDPRFDLKALHDEQIQRQAKRVMIEAEIRRLVEADPLIQIPMRESYIQKSLQRNLKLLGLA